MGGLSEDPEDFTRIIPRGYSALVLLYIHASQIRRTAYHLNGSVALDRLTERLRRAGHQPL